MEHFDAAAFLRLVQLHRVTHTQVVPTMFVRMLKLAAEVRSRYDLSSLRCAIHAAAPCPVPIKEQMIEWWGPLIWEYYGGTEGNGLTLVNSAQWQGHKGTVGRAVLGTVKICGPDGEELSVGEPGTIYFADGKPFEYHNDANKTAESRLPNGWTTLGDSISAAVVSSSFVSAVEIPGMANAIRKIQTPVLKDRSIMPPVD